MLFTNVYTSHLNAGGLVLPTEGWWRQFVQNHQLTSESLVHLFQTTNFPLQPLNFTSLSRSCKILENIINDNIFSGWAKIKKIT